MSAHAHGRSLAPAIETRGLTKVFGSGETAVRALDGVDLEIEAGRVNPKLLLPEDRQACVRQLHSEGLSVPEAAQFLKCCDRTITRDRDATPRRRSVRTTRR